MVPGYAQGLTYTLKPLHATALTSLPAKKDMRPQSLANSP
jgi:hypothetical protein